MKRENNYQWQNQKLAKDYLEKIYSVPFKPADAQEKFILKRLNSLEQAIAKDRFLTGVDRNRLLIRLGRRKRVYLNKRLTRLNIRKDQTLDLETEAKIEEQIKATVQMLGAIQIPIS